jgi:DNA-binding CsgD family transcriptional regulator
MEDLFALIAALHEGVVEDERWLAALDRLSDAFGGCALFLGTTQRSGSAFELSGHRVDPQWIELVNGELAGHDANPIYAAVSSALRADPTGTIMNPIRLSRMLDRDTYHSSPIYIHAIAPAGHEHAMTMVLWADSASALSLTLVRQEKRGDFSDREAELARAVGPHILGALKLRHQFALARSSALMLDRFDHGVILLSAAGHIVHANSEAEALLSKRDGLTFEHGQLRAAYPADSRQLRQMLSEADRAARGASLQPRQTLRLPRPSGQPDLIARVLPVAPVVASSFGAGELATIALFIHDPGRGCQRVDEVIGEGLGLSQAEAAVAARIWEGDSVAEAASALGLSPNTVKTHLKAVFEKAGVDRQAALVRRIAQII